MKICFVATHPTTGIYGGAEIAMATLAGALAQKGFEIHYASYQVPKKNVEGITFHKIPLNMNKLRILKALSYMKDIKQKAFKWLAMDKALDEADCDVYIQVNAGFPTGLVADYCRRKNRKFIFRSTCLWDPEGEYPKWSPFSKQLYQFGLNHANLICTNSTETARRFKELRKVALCIKDGFNLINKTNSDGDMVLWVGRNVWYKRPEYFIKIHSLLPMLDFGMVGIKRKEVKKTIYANLKIYGRVKPENMNLYYSKAMMVVNTSIIEGFPNTLVEAGMHGLPYVSFVDPDGVIKQFNLGIRTSTLYEMVIIIRKLAKDKNLRSTLGKNGRNYVEKFHDIKRIVEEWKNLFRSL